MYEQWLIRVTGVVQGVGYRPFVHQLATSLGLGGWTLNDNLGVQAEVCGPPDRLAEFATLLRTRAPALARVEEVRVVSRAPAEAAGDGAEGGDGAVPAFEIRESVRTGKARTVVAPDSHVCEDCLREVGDPADRRYRYPFTNCTNCGPRYSLITGLPYDRAQTTMASFEMCGPCRAEYTDPADRRYHAQPTACPDCGPRLTLHSPDGVVAERDEALLAVREALAAGKIVAVKSVGGFHLAVDARDAAAVARLRRRKKRDSKPFAVMTAQLDTVERLALCTDTERAVLCSPARPVVLLRKRPGSLPEEVAPRNPNLGLMLPSAPLHQLLLEGSGPDVLVMTSGNISGRPIVHRDEEALATLFPVADLILCHDREIHVRVDDSVVRCSDHPALDEPVVTFLRRSRGYAPYPVKVSPLAEPVIAYGAELKTTVAVGSGDEVYVSQHIGDLKNDETYASHQEAAAHLSRLYGLNPRVGACDMHPAFRARIVAAAAGSRAGTTAVADIVEVQHHHAHMAACMAENRISGPTVGVVFDGAGYGEDGTVWGGEFLLGDFASARRVAHLRPVPLLGGDRAVAEPIRTGFALALQALGGTEAAVDAFPALGALDATRRDVFATMAERGIQSPPVSSMGRLFDGIAALLGVCSHAEYEAQGPVELEGLLGRDLTPLTPYPFEPAPLAAGTEGPAGVLDPRPLVRALAADLAAGTPVADISRRFHSTVVDMVVRQCRAVEERYGVRQVALSGGVFLNEFLHVNCLTELRKAGFAAYTHRLVPANDGGIALGQVMVADARNRASAQPDDRSTSAHPDGAASALPDDRRTTEASLSCVPQT